MVLIIIILSIIFLIIGGISKKSIFFEITGVVWLFILVLILFVGIVNLLTPSNDLEKEDYYGEYIIDRNYFSGKQADWQYNHFRLKITEKDSIFLFITEKEKILKTYKGSITTVKPYNSERLVLQMEKPTHHIIETNPTTYRQGAGKFYLVFNSSKFHNMYFRKGKWKKLN